MKKVVSLILSIVMVMSVCCISVSAKSYQEVTQKTFELDYNEIDGVDIYCTKGEKVKVEIRQCGSMCYSLANGWYNGYISNCTKTGENQKVELGMSINDSKGKHWDYETFTSKLSKKMTYTSKVSQTGTYTIAIRNITDVPGGLKISDAPYFTIRVYKYK